MRNMEQEQLYRQTEQSCPQEKQIATATKAKAAQKQHEQTQKVQQAESTVTTLSEATFSAMRQAALSMFKQRTKDLTKVSELEEEMNVLEAQLAHVQGTTTQLQHLHANLENAIEMEENKVTQRTAQVHAAHEQVRQLAEEHAQVNALRKNTSKVALQLKNFVHDINYDGSQLRSLCAEARRVIDHRSYHDFRSLCGELRRRRFMLENLTSKVKVNVKEQQEEVEHNLPTTTEEKLLMKQEQQEHKEEEEEEEEEEQEEVANKKSEEADLCTINKMDNNDLVIDENSSIAKHNDKPVKISDTLTDFAALFEEERIKLLKMLEQWLGQANPNNSSQTNNINNVARFNFKENQAKWQEYDELQVMHSHMRDFLQCIRNSTKEEEESEEEITIEKNNANLISNTSETSTTVTIPTTKMEKESVFPALPLVQINTQESYELENKNNANGDDIANTNVVLPELVYLETSDALISKVNTLIDKYTNELGCWCMELERVHAACECENIYLSCDFVEHSHKIVNDECANAEDDKNEESNEEQHKEPLGVVDNNDNEVVSKSNSNSMEKKDENCKECQVVKCVLMHEIDDLKQKWQTFYANYGHWINLREEYIDELRYLRQLEDQVRDSQCKLHTTQTHITELVNNWLHDNVQHTAILSEEVENYAIVTTRAHHTLQEQAKMTKELENKTYTEEKQALAIQEEISRNASLEVQEQTEWSQRMNDLHSLVEEEEKRKTVQLQLELDEAQNVMQMEHDKLVEINAVCDELMWHITSNKEECTVSNNIVDAINNNFYYNKNNGHVNETLFNANIVKILTDCNGDGEGKLQWPEDTITLLPEDVCMLSEVQVKEIMDVLLSFTCNNIESTMTENNNTNNVSESLTEKETMPDVLAMELSQHDDKEEVQLQPEEESRTNVKELQNITISAPTSDKMEEQEQEKERKQEEKDNANVKPANDISSSQNDDDNKDIDTITKKDASDISTIVRYWASLLPASVCTIVGEKIHNALQEKEVNKTEHEKVMQRIAKNVELLQLVCSQVQY